MVKNFGNNSKKTYSGHCYTNIKKKPYIRLWVVVTYDLQIQKVFFSKVS